MWDNPYNSCLGILLNIERITALNTSQPSFWSILYRTIITHSVTYFLIGILASIFLGYSERMLRPDIAPIIRQITDPILIVSPWIQPIRALLLAIVFYLLKDVLFNPKNGWLVMWIMLAVVGVLSPFGASWGSIEGMIFFSLPIVDHIVGWPEVFLQTLLLSTILTYWVNHPENKRLGVIMTIGFVATILLPLLALLSR
jgi:hypothetical protein